MHGIRFVRLSVKIKVFKTFLFLLVAFEKPFHRKLLGFFFNEWLVIFNSSFLSEGWLCLFGFTRASPIVRRCNSKSISFNLFSYIHTWSGAVINSKETLEKHDLESTTFTQQLPWRYVLLLKPKSSYRSSYNVFFVKFPKKKFLLRIRFFAALLSDVRLKNLILKLWLFM